MTELPCLFDPSKVCNCPNRRLYGLMRPETLQRLADYRRKRKTGPETPDTSDPTARAIRGTMWENCPNAK